MKLSKKEIENLEENIGTFISIEGKEYYCKYALDDGEEILANRLASHIGIITPKDYFFKSRKDRYYLSESFNNEGNFKSAKELGIKSDSLYDIWIRLEELYPSDIKDLMYELVKVFLFDIFLMLSDRNLGNYGVLERNGKRHIVILDNEFIFSDIETVLKAQLDFDDRLKKYTNLKRRTMIINSIDKNMKAFEYFLATTSSEWYQVVIDIYNKLTPDVVLEEFLHLEEEGIFIEEKEYYMRGYINNYKCIEKILKERKIINGVSKNK